MKDEGIADAERSFEQRRLTGCRIRPMRDKREVQVEGMETCTDHCLGVTGMGMHFVCMAQCVRANRKGEVTLSALDPQAGVPAEGGDAGAQGGDGEAEPCGQAEDAAAKDGAEPGGRAQAQEGRY